MWFRAVLKKEQFCAVIFKIPLWPVNQPRIYLWFRAVVKKEQFCVVILKHLSLPVNKLWFTCGFVQWLKRSSLVWLL